MVQLRMTKTVLAERRRALESGERALVSLRLKRQQVAFELARERAERDRLRALCDTLEAAAGAISPAADCRIAIEPLVAIARVERATDVRLGIRLPRLVGVYWHERPYPLEASPPWLELALESLRQQAQAQMALAIAEERVAAMAAGLARAVQRVNLLEQRLVPEARSDIARISQFLADAERTALARAKLAMRQIAARGARAAAREAGANGVAEAASARP